MTYENITDGQELALINEVEALYWLHRFGGLLTRQVAALVWPEASQDVRMAQRTLRRLATAKEVLRRELRTGGVIHVLSEAGARRLREHGFEASARGTRDLRWTKPYHRVLANDTAIQAHLQGSAIWTEFEIQRGRAPLRKLMGCIPDVLVCEDPDNFNYLDWIEVENAAKSRARLGQMLKLADWMLRQADGYQVGQYCINSFTFVIPNRHAFHALARVAKERLKQGRLDPDALDRMWLRAAYLSPQLALQGIGEREDLGAWLKGDKGDGCNSHGT